MKYHFQVLVLLIIFVALPGAALAVRGQLGDAVDGDKHGHNFSRNADVGGPRAAANGTEDSTRICVFCHTPHGASAESTLWNRKDPATASFPLYGDPYPATNQVLRDPSVQPLAQYGPSYGVYPNGASRLCMSCHDGVSAIGDVLNVGDSDIVSGIEMEAGSETIQNKFGAASTLIIKLDVSHPISFVYNSAVATALSNAKIILTGDTFAWPPDPTIAPLDAKERMQCTTCHDPHNDTLLSGDAGLPMWRHITGNSTTEYDEVCTQCHAGADWTATNKQDHTQWW